MINFSDYTDFFIFLGGLLIIGGVIYFFLRHRLQNIFIAEQEAERIISDPQKLSSKLSGNVYSQALFKKLNVILLIIIIAGFVFNQFLMWRMGLSGILNEQVLSFGKKLFSISINITRK